VKLRVTLTALLLSAIAALALSGARPTRIFIPSPEVILAQNATTSGAVALLDMKYEKSARIYADALPRLPEERHHRRMEARAQAHLGLWEEAATLFQTAARDSRVRSAADADAERLRALDAGRGPLEPGIGHWQRLRPLFARDERVGAVAVLDGNLLAVAHPGDGRVTFWSPTGARLGSYDGLGRIAGLAPDGNAVWAVDMQADRLFRIAPDQGVTARFDLGAHGVHGARAVAAAEDGSAWVADFGAGRALLVSKTGEPITEAGLGRIEGPTAVLSVGADLLVAESERDRVLRFDRNGRLLRAYVHPSLKEPVALTAFPGGFLVQSRSGSVFWSATNRDDLAGPIITSDGEPLVTASLGLGSDAEGNLWWGDGASLQMARRVPVAMPMHLLEVLRCRAERGHGGEALLSMTVSVLSRDGRAIETLDKRAFRLIRDRIEMEPIRVENLSRTMSGRRFTIVWESSDELLPHRASLLPAMEYFLRALRPEDQTSIIDLTDTFRRIRDFTVSPDLVRNALEEDRERVAAIDLRPEAPLAHAILNLAPTDYARAVIWVTSGENFTEEMSRRLTRMAVVNQTPVFILHAGATGESLLRNLADRTQGRYFRLYGEPSPADIAAALEPLRSGRYRITTAVPLSMPQERGSWYEVTCEAVYLTEIAFDRVGYYAY
jgi:hypothetical protein